MFHNISFLSAVLFILAALLIFQAGRNFPCLRSRKKLERKYIRTLIKVKYCQPNAEPWECVQIVGDGERERALGCTFRSVVLSNGYERLHLFNWANLYVGDKVMLRLREDSEYSTMKFGFGVVNEQVVPVLVERNPVAKVA